jgi:polysaccharide pyruvyl transferase WcaK-like protein
MGIKSKKILLLGGGFTTKNMGVWALSSSAITSALKAFPGSQIFFFDYNLKPEKFEIRQFGKNVSVQLINIRFSKRFWISNNIARLVATALLLNFIPFKNLKFNLLKKNRWLRDIWNSDIICSIAGGDSFSDIYGIERLVYVALPQILVLLMKKPLILLPQTIGPFKSLFGKSVARYILMRAHKVYSRDHETIKDIRERFSNKIKIQFCYDMGFILESVIAENKIPTWFSENDNSRPWIGLNISGLLYVGGYTKKNMFKIKIDYHNLLKLIINRFIEKHNAFIILVPHVKGEEDSIESDVIACREMFSENMNNYRNRLRIFDNVYNHHEIKALIGRCDFFIGSRMHACIAALSQCVPTVGLAYSQKFCGVFSSIEMEELVIDLRTYDESSIIALVDQIFKRRSEIRSTLEKKVPAVIDRVMSLFETME